MMEATPYIHVSRLSMQVRQRTMMETEQRRILPSPRPVPSTGGVQESNPAEAERATAFGKEVIGITGSAIMAGISGYKEIAKGVSLLFKAGGFSSLLTFISAVILTNFQLHLPPGGWHTRCTDLSSAVLVSLTSILLMATNAMFVALMNKDDTVLVILVLPVVIVVGMLACADVRGDAAQGTVAAAEQDEAYEAVMKSNAELASFSANAAFAIEGVVILGYLKYPSFAGCSHSQVDLATSFFASTVSVLAMTVTALPVRALLPSARARLVAIVSHLKYAMLAALISTAMILAVVLLDWWFMLSLIPEVIAGTLNVAIMAWREGGGGEPDPGGPGVDDGEAEGRERMVKGFKAVATMSFTLMAGTYTVCLGHTKYDVYLRAAMLVMLAAIVSSLRQILRPFELDFPRARGWWAVAVGAVSLLFPGLALVIAGPLLVKIFVHFYFETR